MTLRPTRNCGWLGSRLDSRSPPRGFSGAQQGLPASSGCRLVHQSSVHSQTLPAMSNSPKPLAGKLPDGCGAGPAALAGAAPREVRPVPGVRHDPAVRPGLVAPGERGALEPAARGVLPLGLGGQPAARPGGVRLRVLVGDMDHRVVRRRSTELPGPSGWRQQAPGVHAHHWLRCRRSTGPSVPVKTIEPGCELLRRRARVVGRVQRPLGDRGPAGRLTNAANRALVTVTGSIANAPTWTRWAGASSG